MNNRMMKLVRIMIAMELVNDFISTCDFINRTEKLKAYFADDTTDPLLLPIFEKLDQQSVNLNLQTNLNIFYCIFLAVIMVMYGISFTKKRQNFSEPAMVLIVILTQMKFLDFTFRFNTISELEAHCILIDYQIYVLTQILAMTFVLDMRLAIPFSLFTVFTNSIGLFNYY